MNFLLGAFRESNGSPSSMRVLTAIVVLIIIAGWFHVTYQTRAMAPLVLDGPGGILLGALGIKAYQRGREKEPGSTTVQEQSSTTVRSVPQNETRER